MRAVLLIGGNFLRQLRWYMGVMLFWVVGLAAIVMFSARPAADDVIFLVRQEAAYGVVFAVFVAAGAIHGDRKTRRILSILSKAVERRQYLAGLLLGTLYETAILFAFVIASSMAMAHRVELPEGGVWTLVVPMMTASILAASVAVLFSTLLHPLVATGASIAMLLAQFNVERLLPHSIARSLPMFSAISALVRFDFGALPIPWLGCALALVESAVCWAIAGAIFASRDIAVAVD